MINSQVIPYPRQLSSGQKTARNIAFTLLQKLDVGALTILESFDEERAKQRTLFGCPKKGTPQAMIEVKNPAFYSRVLSGGSIAAAEAYMDGWWESPDLTLVMELMAANISTLDSIESRVSLLSKFAYRVGHWFNRNTVENSAKNIEAHYDLSNDLYQTFLDKRMLYSSALYRNKNGFTGAGARK